LFSSNPESPAHLSEYRCAWLPHDSLLPVAVVTLVFSTRQLSSDDADTLAGPGQHGGGLARRGLRSAEVSFIFHPHEDSRREEGRKTGAGPQKVLTLSLQNKSFPNKTSVIVMNLQEHVSITQLAIKDQVYLYSGGEEESAKTTRGFYCEGKLNVFFCRLTNARRPSPIRRIPFECKVWIHTCGHSLEVEPRPCLPPPPSSPPALTHGRGCSRLAVG